MSAMSRWACKHLGEIDDFDKGKEEKKTKKVK